MALRIDDIDYFLAVAAHGQVRAAAEAVGVSQPALTKGIQRLERELGFPLFVREARGMTLTPVAEGFRARVRTLRASLGDAVKEAADLHLGALGLLRVGVSPLYAERLFVPAWAVLHAQRPAARVRVTVNLNDALLDALRRGDLDLALFALSPGLPDELQAEPLLDDDLCLVVREGHPLLARRRLRLADLADADWMLPGPGVAARRAVEARLTEAGLPPPRVAVEFSNIAAQLARLLLHSDLVGLASLSTLQTPAGAGLVALPLAEARFARRIGLITRRDVPLSPLAARFVEVLRGQQRGG